MANEKEQASSQQRGLKNVPSSHHNIGVDFYTYEYVREVRQFFIKMKPKQKEAKDARVPQSNRQERSQVGDFMF